MSAHHEHGIAPDHPARSASFTVVTLNIFGVPFAKDTRARLATIARELNQPSIDAICFQEVQMAHYVPLLTRALTRFPFAAFEPFVYAPKGGLLTLSRRHFEETSFVLFEDRGWWHTLSIADWMLHKGALATHMLLGETPVVVVNTHLIANYDANWSRGNRYAEAEAAEMRQLIRLINHQDPDALVIVVGDFNFPRHCWIYREFVEAIGAVDPLAHQSDPTFRPPLSLQSWPAYAIDHVFVRPPRGIDVQIEAHLLFDQKVRLVSGRHDYVSDHLGIQATIRWQTERG